MLKYVAALDVSLLYESVSQRAQMTASPIHLRKHSGIFVQAKAT